MKRTYLAWPFLLLVSGCTADGLLLDVTLDGVPTAVRTLQVVPAIAGGRSWKPQPLEGDAGRFNVVLPAGTTGHLVLQVQGLDDGGCQVVAGSGALDLLPGDTRRALTVALAAAPGCVVRVGAVPGLVAGGGKVTSDPPGLVYQGMTTAARFRTIEAQVRLHAEPDADSYLAGWSGACAGSGSGDCVLAPQAGEQDVGVAFQPRRTCLGDDFCWENPLPQGDALLGLSARSSTDAWAVGAVGTVLRWNGAFWALVQTPWVVGTGPVLYGVWARAADDVWIVGAGGTVLRWDGGALHPLASGTKNDLEGVAGTSDGTAWIVGTGGTVLRWDGGALQAQGGFPGRALHGVWTGAPGEAWVAGEGGCVWHLDQDIVTPSCHGGAELRGVWGSSPQDLWAVGGGAVLHWQGKGWIDDAAAEALFPGSGGGPWQVWGSGPGDVWVAGDGGRLAHYDGAWVAVPSSTGVALHALGGSGADLVFAAGAAGTLLRGAEGFFAPLGTTLTSTLYRVRYAGSGGSLGPGDVIAAADGGQVLRWDGAAWQALRGAAGALHDVWRAPTGTLFAVGEDGGIWCTGDGTACAPGDSLGRFTSPTRAGLWGLWGPGASDAAGWTIDLWFVGDGGMLLHLDATQAFTKYTSPTANRLRRVWGAGSHDVWAVGDGGAVLHYDGTAWAAVPVPAAAAAVDFQGVDGVAGEVWVAGGGLALRYADAAGMPAVVPLPLDPGKSISDVWVAVRGDAWLSGDTTVLHFAGAAPARGDLRFTGTALWGVGGGAGYVWAVGEGGAILRRGPGQAR